MDNRIVIRGVGVESKRMEGGEKRSEKYTREKETKNSSASTG